MPEPRFDPMRIIEVLDSHGVAYVLIGGMAAVSLGAPLVTQDIDICYRRDRANLEALANALRQLNATLRGVDEDVRFPLDADALANGNNFTFNTDAGPLDCIGVPAGTDGFDDLIISACKIDLDGIEVLVAGIDDLMRMKRASRRPKDQAALPILLALKDEVESRPS
jgi:hypothetical protein